jgi:hypothetical protein
MVHSTPAMKMVAVVSSRRKACPVSMMESLRRLSGEDYQIPDYLLTDDRVDPVASPPPACEFSRPRGDGWSGRLTAAAVSE